MSPSQAQGAMFADESSEDDAAPPRGGQTIQHRSGSKTAREPPVGSAQAPRRGQQHCSSMADHRGGQRSPSQVQPMLCLTFRIRTVSCQPHTHA